jgi:putative hydrolase of the HAD superfamily
MLRYLILDLDDTLYSHERGMEKDILRRMNEFVASYLGMDLHEARELRHARVKKYGTTLEWLMSEEGFADPELFFASIHPEGEEYCIESDPRLAAVLGSIDLPKAVFTNSPSEHAERVLRKLGVRDRFEAVYDIRFCALKGKPHAAAFKRVCGAIGVEPKDALFIDDMPKYVRGFVELGGQGVVLDEYGKYAETGLRRIHGLAELPDLFAEERAAASQLNLFD